MYKHGLCIRKMLVSTFCAMLAATSWAYESNPATTGVDEYPSGTPVVPPKPKARDGGEFGFDEYPSGAPIIPPKPKAREDGETGVDEYPTGTPVVPPKPKARDGGEFGFESLSEILCVRHSMSTRSMNATQAKGS
ncbi:MAG: hypothetical protein HY836_07725 [Aquabacterium sp.]|uniref:hypothetical protein n=1 Tax=Aquabacterium sp. TaxID=1872578 RepID=UPI0025B87B8B|nr:hypothetical protein [Aquabacterium sp.]MBI5925476.1 hypothetical protein [Aquabacterium sp.]